MKFVYFDNNVIMCVDLQVVLVMLFFFIEQFGNVLFMYVFGVDVLGVIKIVCRSIQVLIGVEYDYEIVFIFGGMESDNIVVFLVLEVMFGCDEIIMMVVEYLVLLQFCEYLEKLCGIKVYIILVDVYGCFDIVVYKVVLLLKIVIVFIMWVNNEIGMIFLVVEFVEFVKEVGVFFYIDVVQVVGKILIDLKLMQIDMLLIFGYKFNVFKGIGVFYVW